MKTCTCAFLLLTLLASCAIYYTEVDKQQFEQAFILNSSSTFQGTYYQGSDKDYHYFLSKWQFEPDRYFKISTHEITVDHPRGRETEPVLLSPLKQDELSKGQVKVRELKPEPTPAIPSREPHELSEDPSKGDESEAKPRTRKFSSVEELQKYLQAQQMEAIRSGKPPLPIPLTPELDRQMVEEGTLPPQRKGAVE